LINVAIDCIIFFLLVVRLIGGVTLPPSLLLLPKGLLLILVLALDADAKLPAFYSFFEAQAILFLAV
jgi:hypothetical protein